MPIPFDAHRIIRFDNVDTVGLLGKLDKQLALAASECFGTPKFVVLAGFQKVNKSNRYGRAPLSPSDCQERVGMLRARIEALEAEERQLAQEPV